MQSEEAISQFEKPLKKCIVSKTETPTPMTIQELNDRIDKSEANFKANRFKPSSEIIVKN